MTIETAVPADTHLPAGVTNAIRRLRLANRNALAREVMNLDVHDIEGIEQPGGGSGSVGEHCDG